MNRERATREPRGGLLVGVRGGRGSCPNGPGCPRCAPMDTREARRRCLQKQAAGLVLGVRLFQARIYAERARLGVEPELESEFGRLAVAVQIATREDGGALAVFRGDDLVL